MIRKLASTIDVAGQSLKVYIIIRTQNDTQEKPAKPRWKSCKYAKDQTEAIPPLDDNYDWDNEAIEIPDTDGQTIRLGVCDAKPNGFPSYTIYGTSFRADLESLNGLMDGELASKKKTRSGRTRTCPSFGVRRMIARLGGLPRLSWAKVRKGRGTGGRL
jgi:hypothetical protein